MYTTGLFVIKTMEIGSRVESGQCTKSRRCFQRHVWQTLPSLNRRKDLDYLYTKRYKYSKSFLAHLKTRVWKCCPNESLHLNENILSKSFGVNLWKYEFRDYFGSLIFKLMFKMHITTLHVHFNIRLMEFSWDFKAG